MQILNFFSFEKIKQTNLFFYFVEKSSLIKPNHPLISNDQSLLKLRKFTDIFDCLKKFCTFVGKKIMIQWKKSVPLDVSIRSMKLERMRNAWVKRLIYMLFHMFFKWAPLIFPIFIIGAGSARFDNYCINMLKQLSWRRLFTRIKIVSRVVSTATSIHTWMYVVWDQATPTKTSTQTTVVCSVSFSFSHNFFISWYVFQLFKVLYKFFLKINVFFIYLCTQRTINLSVGFQSYTGTRSTSSATRSRTFFWSN